MRQLDDHSYENMLALHSRVVQLGDGLDALGVAIGSMGLDETTTAGLGCAVASLGVYARETLGVHVEVLIHEMEPIPEQAAGEP